MVPVPVLGTVDSNPNKRTEASLILARFVPEIC
jgi:hypothetical protein